MATYAVKKGFICYKALYRIHSRVAKKFPEYKPNQVWAITYGLYYKTRPKGK